MKMSLQRSGSTATNGRTKRGGDARSRIAVVGLGVAFAIVAHAAPLHLKPGLWERSVTTMTELVPSGKYDLSKLDPDVREKLAKAMSGSVTTGRRIRVTQECVSAATVEKWTAFAHDESANLKCTRKIVTEDARHLKAALTCDGGKTTADIDFTVNGERVKGSVAMVSHEQDFDRIVKQEVAGKWIGQNCNTSEAPKLPE